MAPDHAQHVLVDEEVLAETLLGSRGHGNENAADALASSRASSTDCSSPRTAASVAAVCDDVRRLVRASADGLRREIRAVRLDEQTVQRHERCGIAKVGSVRESDVSGERDVVPALERRRQERRGGEAVEDDGAARIAARAAAVSSAASRLWITTGRPSSSARSSCASKSAALLAQGRGIAKAVESGLPDRDDLRMSEQLA